MIDVPSGLMAVAKRRLVSTERWQALRPPTPTRAAGHAVIGLIVGKAMSGAFLAHGYRANRLIAFNDKGVLIHAMGKASAARITLRSVEALEKLAATIPPMAYDINNYATLGLLSSLLDISNPDAPSDSDLTLVKTTLQQAISDARQIRR